MTDNPVMQLATMSRWYVVSRAIHTVAQLGLANYMSRTPQPIAVLAAATKTKPELLERLLQFLSAYDLFYQVHDQYALTDLSAPLRDDHPQSIRDVLCMVDDKWWQAFSDLGTILVDGKAGFLTQHGQPFFEYLSQHPAKQIQFDSGMAKLSSYDDVCIAAAYDFSKYTSLVDMGGGRGGLSRAIAKQYPELTLLLFETKAVIDTLQPADFPPNVQCEIGDFFKTIPSAQAYLFKGVLHDFSDSLMEKILSNCHEQMPQDADLLIVEQVIPEQNGPHPNKTMDIVMMALLAGRQRTTHLWADLAAKLGFHLEEAIPTDSLFTLMRFRKM